MAEQAQIEFDRVTNMECQSCHTQIDVSTLPTFSSAICPSCGKEVIVPGKLGNYLLLNCLGNGGMGSVYRAYDETLARIVAIKVMLKSLGDAKEFLESFRREAQAAAKLNHPNIAQIYSFGQEKGQPYIVMELVGGKHFDEMIAQPEPLDQAMVMKIGMDIADGLQLAAASNLIHGDIKPENILLDERDTAKLLDFGIASSPNTQSTEIWGTPYYIAPEKLKRQRVDFRSDIYCLGGTLYHALTQHPPFEGPDAMAVVKARLEHPPEPMKTYRPDIDPEVEAIIDRMLQVEPAMRYPTYGSLLSDMRKYLSRVQPVMPSATTTSSKKIVIKGRGKGAGSSSASTTQSMGGPASGKHHISVSRGMVDPMSITSRHASQHIQPPGDVRPAESRANDDSEEKKSGSKALKIILISVISAIVLIGCAVGGIFFHLSNQHKKAMAAYSEQITKRDNALAQLKRVGQNAVKLRDDVMSVYTADADNIVSQALAAVEAEIGTEFTSRITYEAPEPAEEEVPEEVEEEESSEDAEGEVSEGEEAKAEDSEKAEGEETAAEGEKAEEGAEGEAAEEKSDEEKPAEEEKSEEAPAEEGEAPAEGEAEADGGDAAAEEAPAEEGEPLEGLALQAREVFEALAPVRKASRLVNKANDKIAMRIANAEAKAQKVSSTPPDDKSELQDGTEAAEKNTQAIEKELSKANDIYEEARAATDDLQAVVRKAKTKLGELLNETSKLAAERKRQAEEAEKQRLAEEAEAARRAEAERLAEAKKAEISRILGVAAANLGNLQAFKFDMVIRELNHMERDLQYPESKKALKTAIKRIECLKELKTFLVERLTAVPFVHPRDKWSVKSASERVLEIVGKDGKSDSITWEKIKLPQMVAMISFYLDKEDNVKELKLRPHMDALRNAAVYYMTVAPENPGAQKFAAKYLKQVIEKLPSRKNEIKELLPELQLETEE